MSDFGIGKMLMQDEWPLHMRAMNLMVLKGDKQFVKNKFLS